MEVTQAEFARMCGVRPPSISEKIKNGTLILNSGKRLDTDNPVNRNYLTAKQNRLQIEMQTQNFSSVTCPASETKTNTTKAPKTALNTAAANPAVTTGLSEQMLNMTILQLVTNYGGVAGVERFTKTLQTLTTANEKELRIQERRQELIPKDFVTSRIFGYIDNLMSKLLDYPEGAVDAIIAKVQADTNSRGDIVNYMRDGLTRCICDAKQHITNELDNLRNKYDTSRNDIEDIKEAVEGLKNADD